MTRFWTLTVGLSLTVLAARNMGASGIDPVEFNVLGLVLLLVAVAVVIEGLCSFYENREEERTARAYAAAGLSPEGLPFDTDPDNEVERTTLAAQAAAPAPVRETRHELHRTWAPRPDQKLPPGEDDKPLNARAASRAEHDEIRASQAEDDNPGTAERIRRAIERGERV